jgi:pilus assembly protein CpaB
MGRSVIVLGLAIICGVSSAYGIVQLRRPSGNTAAVEAVSILVATKELTKGQMLTEKDVSAKEWPKSVVPEGAMTKIEDVKGHAVLVPILAGEPLVAAKLATDSGAGGLAALVPTGMRAYTIQTSSAASSVGGFVRPGNIVDVLLNLRGSRSDGTGGGSTKTLLQAVEILAVDRFLEESSKEPEKEFKSVTLLVTPDQVAKLDLGQHMGTLTLSLRNPLDKAETETRLATVKENLPMALDTSDGAPEAQPEEAAASSADCPEASPENAVLMRSEPLVRTLRGSTWGKVKLAEVPEDEPKKGKEKAGKGFFGLW